jgi:hypothetical protein
LNGSWVPEAAALVFGQDPVALRLCMSRAHADNQADGNEPELN